VYVWVGIALLVAAWLLGRRRNHAQSVAVSAAIAELRSQVAVLTQVSNRFSVNIGGEGRVYDNANVWATGVGDPLLAPVSDHGYRDSLDSSVRSGRLQGVVPPSAVRAPAPAPELEGRSDG